ncbi:TolC family protein [Planctomycetota bacterium]
MNVILLLVKERRCKQVFLLAAMVVFASGCAQVKGEWRYDGAGREALLSGGTQRELPKLDDNAELGHYLTYAAISNPGLEAAFDRWAAAVERIPQALALKDPTFSYTHFIEEVETRVGPQKFNVGLSQMFPWFGKRELRGNVVAREADAESQRFLAAKLKLFYRVKYAYYEYYYLGRAIAVTQENVRLLTSLESVVRTKYQAGSVPHSALIRIQVGLAELEDRLRSLQDLRIPVMAGLNAALGRSDDAPLPWPKEVPRANVSITDAQLVSWLKENNPELRSIDFKAAEEETAIKLAGKNRFPDVTFGVAYVETDDTNDDPVTATIAVNLPIWTGKYLAQENEARAKYRTIVNTRADREHALVSDLKMAAFGFRDAERKVGLYRDTLIPKAEQGFKVTRQAFEAGKADVLDLVDAEKILLEFTLSRERALANRAQRLAEMEMLVGKEIPRADDPPVETKGQEE